MDGGRNASKVPDEIKEMIDGYFTESVAKGTGAGIIKAEVNETVARAKKISNSREKSRIINEAINAKTPVFAEDLRKAYKKVDIKEGCQDIVLQGYPYYTEYEKTISWIQKLRCARTGGFPRG